VRAAATWRSSLATPNNGRAVENIATFNGELLYWVAILFSNSLGTFSGDFLADSVGLGFADSALLLSAIMLLLLAAHYLTRINPMVLFWIAFVLTRPLGATAGDSLSKPRALGGLGWGTTWPSAALVAVLIALIVYQTIQVRRHPLEPVPVPAHRRTAAPERRARHRRSQRLITGPVPRRGWAEPRSEPLHMAR
jgi:uncharacterized membrane-anchored protein